ncbi:hypothetical protein HMPREF3167_04975 [Trueperella sp. HMSC08B05]|uniref:diacylglycerol/lipid kinase family protein n=1 Tax=Trueperella TaxID=1069494 RepID=UPI0008381E92|nr:MULTISPECIES: diacylglycerol kinase family protein [Trueperella]MDV6239508.1 diacylglycerol kinase family protein [Trueperella bernardiae]OCW60022.1 hypothetical protein AKG36_06855 [Trueperella bernardiae]OFS74756.1 hypothetical protein HMPREF3167_04975 [Trueperella sp. HMSC08B05]PKZ89125.1 diacylglycerol kinase [Trueperella bernardiae]
MDWGIVVGVLGLVVGLFALWSAARVNSSADSLRLKCDANEAEIDALRELVDPGGGAAEAEPPPGKQAGPVVVFNPTKKTDFDYLKTLLARVAADADLPEPIWLPTTAEDPGGGQTRQALEMGASVVIAAGGDGTVRNVAEVLAGTGTPLGLLPVGTGNLLARNLDLPFTSARRMAVTALTGQETTIDVGWLEIPEGAPAPPAPDAPGAGESTDPDASQAAKPGKYAFLVVAGLGFDADIMAAADEESELKAKIGWLAYVKAAMPYLRADRMSATITAGQEGQPVQVEARSVMLLNCGQLVGGLLLDPHTRPDDGWLELGVLDIRRGLIGWVDVARKVGFNGLGLKPVSMPGVQPSGDLHIHRISSATVVAESAQLVQVDGDVLGAATTISGYIDKGALRVRVV